MDENRANSEQRETLEAPAPALPPQPVEHPGVRYEKTDVRVGWIVAVAFLLCALSPVYFYLGWRYFQNRERAQELSKQSPFLLAPKPTDELPSDPRLEQLDQMPGGTAAAAARAQEVKEQSLQHYGTTTDSEYVRIPIETAMRAIAAKLPVREQPEQASLKDRDLVTAGESNSGRVFRSPSRRKGD